MSQVPCPDCHGERLKPESLAVTVGGVNIAAFCRKSVGDALDFIEHLELTEGSTSSETASSKRSPSAWGSCAVWDWSI